MCHSLSSQLSTQFLWTVFVATIEADEVVTHTINLQLSYYIHAKGGHYSTYMRSPVDWSHFNPPFFAGPPPPAGLPPGLLPLLLPLRMLLPHRRLLLRPLLVLLLLPQVAFKFLVLSTSPLLVPQALRQPPQAAPPPVAQPE